jgi:cysteine desulfurase / selenocysteine lyase
MRRTMSDDVEPRPFSPELMAAVRERFLHVDRCPIEGRERVFLENGGGSLKLREALARNDVVAELPDQEGRDNPASRHLSAVIHRGRADLRMQFGSEQGQVVSGESGTRLLWRLVRSVALAAPPGPVVSCTLEHPASLDSARHWAEATGRAWHEVPFDPRTGTVTPDDYARAVGPDTRIATVIHTSQLTGFTVDLPAIVETIRAIAPECFVIVDGIQFAPHGAMDVDGYGCDAYVFSPYKAFSRLAVGFAWIGERLIDLPHERMRGAKPHVWELGSRDVGIYAAQSAVVDHYCWLGGHVVESTDRRALVLAAARAIAAHEAHLVELLLRGEPGLPGLCAMPAVTLVGPPTTKARTAMVSFNLLGLSGPDLVCALRDDHAIRAHARTSDAYSGHILGALGIPDCLRISMCHANGPDEVRRLLRALAAIDAAPRERYRGRARPSDHSP